MSAPTPTAAADYLATAEAAELLWHLDGCPFVVGEFNDEAGGERQCLVEYCDPRLLDDGARHLLTVLRAKFPATDTVVVRTPGEVSMPLPWLAHLTYVRFCGSMPSPPASPVTVTRAGPEHNALIVDWLVRAFETYGEEQQHHADPTEIRAVAQRVVQATDRRSYLAVVDGRAVGHVTLLCDAHDDVTGRRHIELLDALVDLQPPLRGAAMSALTAAAVADSVRAGLPLIGHVVHPTAVATRGKGEAVLRSLRDRGWVIDHRYWRLPWGENGTGQ